MVGFFSRDEIPNWGYVKARCGSEAEKLKSVGFRLGENNIRQSGGAEKFAVLRKIKNIVRTLLLFSSAERREEKLKKILGEEYDLLEVGRFRNSGEIHYWLYDQFSLRRLLKKSGFSIVEIVKAAESRITDWKRYGLDADEKGEAFKPDSIFVEAIK
jgi:hypothetical protein